MVTNEEIMAELKGLREQVAEMAAALQDSKARKEYQSAYYQKRKAAKAKKAAELARTRLSNPDRSVFDASRDYRVPHAKWAAKLTEFAERGLSVWNWLTWLAWSFNQDTWEFPPITRSGGYMHVYIGRSNGKALRGKYTERDVTGHVRVSTFSSAVQLETFAGALFWKYTFRTICIVSGEHENVVEKLPANWQKTLRILMGGFGCYEYAPDKFFDPNEADLNVASKAYAIVRPHLEMGWSSTLKGFFSKEEPFTAPKK